MNQKGFINIILIIIVIALIGTGIYFILNRQLSSPAPIVEDMTEGSITVFGEITCLPKKGPGSQTGECAVGLKGTDDRHYGLKNLSVLDPENKLFAPGLRVEVSGAFKSEEMKGPDGNKYDVVGTIDVSSIREVIDNGVQKGGAQEVEDAKKVAMADPVVRARLQAAGFAGREMELIITHRIARPSAPDPCSVHRCIVLFFNTRDAVLSIEPVVDLTTWEVKIDGKWY